jgi:hypothetical protein
MNAVVADRDLFRAHGQGVHRIGANKALGPGFFTALPTASAHWYGQFATYDGSTWLCREDGLGGYEWVDVGGGGFSSPLTTKGDLLTHDGSDAVRIGVGTDGEVPIADSSAPEGISWGTPAGQGVALTLIDSHDFSAQASVSRDDVFSNTYENYLIVISNYSTSASAHAQIRYRVGGANASGADYSYAFNETLTAGTNNPAGGTGNNQIRLHPLFGGVIGEGLIEIIVCRPFVADATMSILNASLRNAAGAAANRIAGMGMHTLATSYDGFTLFMTSGTMDGSLRVYGLQNSPGDPGPSGFSDEDAQDAVGSIWLDSSSINFTYDDATPSMTAVVLPAGVDHNSLANLTTGDPHTQYMLETGGTFSGDIIVPAEAYGAGWNGSNEAPTKNDIFDKIDTLTFADIDGAVTDAQVPNTITLDNITQITTRSHTSLTDIGTNTHAQIDTHIAAANPHSGAQPLDADLTALAGLAGVQGDIIYRDATQWQRLPKGTALQILRQNAALTAPEWGTDDPLVARFMLAADAGAAIGPAIANFFGATSAFSTEATSRYLIQAFLSFLKTTAGTVTFTLTSSTNVIGARGAYQGTPLVGGTASSVAGQVAQLANPGAATAIPFPVTGSLTTAVEHTYMIWAIVETNTAGNIRLNITSGAGTVTPRKWSFYRVWKLASGNIGSFVA